MSDVEKVRLEKVASWLSMDQGMQGRMTYWCAVELAKLAQKTSCLELGCADGYSTEVLAPHFQRFVAVDGSDDFVNRARQRITQHIQTPQVEFVCSLFEDLDLKGERFDTVICSNILEHVEDPVAILRLVAERFVAPGGAILVAVPNADSLHRRAAVYMGLLPANNALNERDQMLAHRRVYTPRTLRADIEAAGLKVGRTGGIFLKVLSNAQLEAQWTPEMIEAYYQLGFEFPDVCAEIYAECFA